MKNYPALIRHVLAAMIFTLVVAVGSAAETSELGQHAGNVPVPAGLTRAQLQIAAEQALLGRQWEVKSKSDDRVVGFLKHRGIEATLTLVLTDGQVEIYCVGWQVNKKSGAREKPEQPTGWIKYIKGDLTKILTRTTGTK
jgi:hypothetical protein